MIFLLYFQKSLKKLQILNILLMRLDITSGPVYCVTLYAELEDDEDTQYPLEDILDKYYVNCTDVMEEREEAGKSIFIFEIEGEDEGAINAIVGFVG